MENVYFGENTWNLNIVCSGGRLYVAFPRLERLENGDQQENVYVYGRFPEGWREVYRACVYTGGGRGVYRTPVSLTATPGGGLVLFFMRDYVWHPEGYYLGLLKTGVMVRSPDGMSWGPEEEVLHSDPDEVGFLFCDSSYYADNGRVPTFSLAVTRWVEYIPFPGRIWFWKGEVRVDNTPPVSSVDPIEPYWQLGELRDPPSDMRLRTPIKITATASDDLSGVAKVELWYRYSLDNWTDAVAWKKRPWRLYGVDDNGTDGWSWEFDAPEGYGYYEFYTVATDRAGNREGPPSVADAWCRVARELLKVAVILVEPNDYEYELTPPRQEFLEGAVNDFRKYFDEVSYGAVLGVVDLFDNGKNLYKLSKGWREYIVEREIAGRKDNFFKKEMVDEAVALVEKTGPFEYETYDAVIAGGAAPIDWVRGWSYDKSITCFVLSPYFVWAHEVGHALGLPDLYRTGREGGIIENWGLMGGGGREGYVGKLHFCSWSKERLGWLRYDSTDLTTLADYYQTRSIQALPTLYYGDGVPRYLIHRWRMDWWWVLVPGYGLYKEWVEGVEGKVWYLLESRSQDWRYSSWDIGVPDTGLVIYKVDWTLRGWPRGEKERINVVRRGDRAWHLGETCIAGEGKGARFSFVSEHFEPSYTTDVEVKYPCSGSVTLAMYQVPFTIPSYGYSTSPPDLDLHAYTYDGKHVGMNYSTGAYEVEIPGATASGDLFNGSEWISVPENLEVYFFVSARDAGEFIESNPGVEPENGMYVLQLNYATDGKTYLSPLLGQIMPPGMQAFHIHKIVQMPDGTYSTSVELGKYPYDPAVWQVMIDNIPDYLFFKQPMNQKRALKNKFEAVFKMLGENDYKGAIEKLEQDILQKLDADGRADWVKQPVLVGEIRALVALLRYTEGHM